MITVAFDEYGNFEKVSEGYEPVMIGGFFYDDHGDETDTASERKRIIGWLDCVCRSKGRIFPDDMHMNHGKTNKDAVKEVKRKYEETAEEFFREGTFDGKNLRYHGKELPKRSGRYHFFAMIRSTTGKRELLGEKTAMIVKDSCAANLYINMAQDLVEKVLFHNPYVTKIEKAALEFPTRLGVAEGDDRQEKSEEFINLGYREMDSKERQKDKYSIVSADLYRSAISREMLRTKKQSMEIVSFVVKSFTRMFDAKNKAANENNAFVFLTDVVNSVFTNRKLERDPVRWMEYIQKEASSFTKDDKNLLYAYTGVDNYFSLAWENFEKKDYYDALQQAYEGSVCKDEFTDFYSKKWFAKVEESVVRSNDSVALTEAIRKFQKSTYASNLNQEKLLYIFHALEKAAVGLKAEDARNRQTLYELYDAGLSAYNHIGHFNKAEEYYRKCQDVADGVDIEQFLRTKNKQIVFLTDRFSFEEAQSIAEENVALHEKLQKVREEVFPGKESANAHSYALALSQLGQTYAFVLDERAEECFLRALTLMSDTSADYYITLSYLLHWYIETGNKEAYEKWMIKFAGGKDNPIDQLKYLLHTAEEEANSLISLKFAMYVFAKGVYCFGLEEGDHNLQSRLFQLRNNMKNAGELAEKQYQGHPWEITNKYLALIALRCGKQTDANRLMREAEERVKEHEFTVKAITLYGKLQYERTKNPSSNVRELMSTLWKSMEQCHLVESGIPDQEKEGYLKNRFTYMYH